MKIEVHSRLAEISPGLGESRWDVGRSSQRQPLRLTRGVLLSYLQEIDAEFPPEIRQRGINRNWHNYRFLLTQIAELMRDRTPSIEYLDLGSGAGVIPLVLAKAGMRVTALDTWTQYAQECDNLMGSFPEFVNRFERYGVRWVQYDLLRTPLPFASGSFDMITLFDVIEHLPKPRTVLEEALRLLRPAGLLLLKFPNTANLRNRLRLLMGNSPHPDDIGTWFSDSFFGHYREMTMQEIQRVLPLSEFDMLSTRYTEACHWNTRLKDGQWSRNFRLKSPLQYAKLAYLLATFLVPSFRYEIFVAAQASKFSADRRSSLDASADQTRL